MTKIYFKGFNKYKQLLYNSSITEKSIEKNKKGFLGNLVRM